MINILCYGDSNTWGNIPGSYHPELRLAKRFIFQERWTGILQNALGGQCRIIEAGLNGRTTAYDETRVNRPSRNGLETLPGIMEMNYPLDWIILMLGTNDVKTEFNASVEQITDNMRKLIKFAQGCHFGLNYQAPKVLLMAPAPIVPVPNPAFGLYYDDSSINKSQQLSAFYNQLSKNENCFFLNLEPLVTISSTDGIHIERDSQAAIALAVAAIINQN